MKLKPASKIAKYQLHIEKRTSPVFRNLIIAKPARQIKNPMTLALKPVTLLFVDLMNFIFSPPLVMPDCIESSPFSMEFRPKAINTKPKKSSAVKLINLPRLLTRAYDTLKDVHQAKRFLKL
ncbi:hypothetical protein L1077_23935 [Pseudoalteromonas luteoviolacea]|uniref:hypothetical protein n=1 Tax=Pseudoalteromonas luteoviolacea TaxID=43657 RepID=UPI001F2281D0|nr:hypothetical protein [Pseudoalteromonas luteoviolacea]MCF6442484.1 hypothetical protein [Pseudoalteromonas luteoviolacea]